MIDGEYFSHKNLKFLFEMYCPKQILIKCAPVIVISISTVLSLFVTFGHVILDEYVFPLPYGLCTILKRHMRWHLRDTAGDQQAAKQIRSMFNEN